MSGIPSVGRAAEGSEIHLKHLVGLTAKVYNLLVGGDLVAPARVDKRYLLLICLISRSTLFIMFAHMFVMFDKTFGALIPYSSMWETDMKMAYRDAASVLVILIALLWIFDAIQKKFPKTRCIFTSIGIK